MYRPENWSRIKHTYFNKRGIDFTTEEKAEAFEAGADAILEGLLAGGIYDIIKFTDKDIIIKLKDIVKQTYRRGTWVHIPDIIKSFTEVK